MLKYLKHRKICNCSIQAKENILKCQNEQSFCKRCGSIIIKNIDRSTNYTLKPREKQKDIDINPIDIIKSMKAKTECYYPNLNKEYNMNQDETSNINETIDSINAYLDKRKMILIHLQKLMKLFDFNDIVFYQSLFYMDYIFSHQMKEKISEKEIILYLIGYFLCSTKMTDIDEGEPPLCSFVKIKDDVFLSVKKIAYYEVLCLKSIDYNIFSYSAYDWLVQLIGAGIVFNCEIDKKNPIILINGHKHTIVNSINKFALKMLLNLTVTDLFIKYSPMQIAFSIIQITREIFLDPNLINVNLFNKLINLYGISFDEYRNCYEELKRILPQDIIENKSNEQEEQKNNDENLKKVNSKYKNIKQYSVKDSFILNINRTNKFFSINKNRSCEDIFQQSEKNIEMGNGGNFKEIIKKINLNKLTPKNKSKHCLENGKIPDQTIQNNIGLSRYIPKQIKNFSVDGKEKLFRSNDSLPLINTRVKTNFEAIEEKNKNKIIRSSKILKYNDNNQTTKNTNSQITNVNPNIGNTTINFKKTNNILYKLGSIKKSLFQGKANNLIRRKSIDKSIIFKAQKKIEIVSFNKNKEEMKINNYNDIPKIVKNSRYNLGIKGRIISLSKNINRSTNSIE